METPHFYLADFQFQFQICLFFYIQSNRNMSSMFKNTHSRHSYPFANLNLNFNHHFSNKSSALSSAFNKTSSSCFSRIDKHEKVDRPGKQTTDLKAFKQKHEICDYYPPISCLKLISTPQPKLFISLSDLDNINFPVLSYTISELSNFSKMILDSSPQRKLVGKSFNLNKLIQLIAQNYLITAYHNFTHAFSLLLMLFQAYNRCQKLRNMINQKQWFYVFIAALMHDLKHPGTTNAFQVKSKSQYAVEAQNVSVLEKMHLTDFWNILKKHSQVNFLQGYASYESHNIKNIITKMVLSTDVANHFKNLDVLKTVTPKTFMDEKDSMFVIQQLFHACDIGNPCLDFNNYISWGALVSFQFDQVATKEKELGLQVTGFLKYDNLKKFYGNQSGFCKGLVLPLWKQLNSVLPGITVFHNNIISNIKELQQRASQEWEQ